MPGPHRSPALAGASGVGVGGRAPRAGLESWDAAAGCAHEGVRRRGGDVGSWPQLQRGDPAVQTGSFAPVNGHRRVPLAKTQTPAFLVPCFPVPVGDNDSCGYPRQNRNTLATL